MKLYDNPVAPNPRKVRMFLAEKGVEIEKHNINLAKGKQNTPEYKAKVAHGKVPALELDDGSVLLESLTICQYLEEIYPEPPLFGIDKRDRFEVLMWERRMEFEVLSSCAGAFRHTTEMAAAIEPNQFPEMGAILKKAAIARFEVMDKDLESREFIAGDRYTMADITALCGVSFGVLADINIQPEQKNLQRWYDAVMARPSAKA